MSSFSEQEGAEERVHRLQLTLISTVPFLPLPLLPLVLDDIREIITRADEASEPGARGRREEMVDALYEGILDRMGDREKEFALQWWYDNRGLTVKGSVQLPLMSHL